MFLWLCKYPGAYSQGQRTGTRDCAVTKISCWLCCQGECLVFFLVCLVYLCYIVWLTIWPAFRKLKHAMRNMFWKSVSRTCDWLVFFFLFSTQFVYLSRLDFNFLFIYPSCCVRHLINNNRTLLMLHQKLCLIDKRLLRKTFAWHMPYRYYHLVAWDMRQ